MLAWGSPALTQTFPVYQEQQVALIDRAALFAQSQVGKALLKQNRDLSQQLAADLRKIEADLRAEESRLVIERKTDVPSVFEEKARLFDEKVKRTRSEQDARLRNLQQSFETAERDFYNRVDPILRELMVERGIVLLLNKDTVLVALADADITAEAIARIDATMKP